MSAGDDLVRAVATPERAVGIIGGLVGDTVAFGPVPTGPGGMATATATGTVGRLRAAARDATRVDVVAPVRLDLTVVVGRREVPVDADLEVRIALHGCLAPDGSQVVVEVAEIGPGDIDVETRTSGMGGVIVRRLGDLDNEIRHHVIAWVTALLQSPEAQDARHLPVELDAETA